MPVKDKSVFESQSAVPETPRNSLPKSSLLGAYTTSASPKIIEIKAKYEVLHLADDEVQSTKPDSSR